MSYVSCMSNAKYMSYVSCVSYAVEFVLNVIFSVFNNSKHFFGYIRLKNPTYKITWNLSKITWIVLKIIFSVFKNFSKNIHEYIRMENPSYKNENIERKYLNNMQKNQFLKVNNSLLELEKDFIELKDTELKDREVEIERRIEELFFKLIIVSTDEMDKFEQKEMKKMKPIN